VAKQPCSHPPMHNYTTVIASHAQRGEATLLPSTNA
jgi:hypothetical protein